MGNRLVIIDYGMGNLHSVASAIQHVAAETEVIISGDHETIRSADHVIFPGVGAMRDCMAEIKNLHLNQLLPEILSNGTPVLGICVGMQALLDSSEENNGIDCLGLFAGQVKFFGGFDAVRQAPVKLKIPHMGWNNVRQSQHHPLWDNIADNSRFYFVHSYCVCSDDQSPVVGRSEYGIEFDAAIARDNLFAVQFHPEKSHSAGLQLLSNFVRWNGRVD